tara:strand:+ start:3009 stop:3233 length:225 start_codon:yes stop_codon:yes gene_type:complete
MVEDGTYEDFKKEYIQCVLKRQDSFNWESKIIAKSYAKAVVMYVDKYAQKEYNDYIDNLAEAHYEMKSEIARGK